MDMKFRRPQLSSEQTERGCRIDREEVKVISQESHLKVICDSTGWQGSICVPCISIQPQQASWFHSRSSQSIKVTQQTVAALAFLAIAPHPHLTSQDETKRPDASESCLAHVWLQNVNAVSSHRNHMVEFVSEICQFHLRWAFCDLLSVKGSSVCVTHMLTRLNDELVCAIAPTHFHLMAIKAQEALSFPGYFQMHKVNITLFTLGKMSQGCLFPGYAVITL